MQLSDQQCVPVSLSMRLLRPALVLLGALWLGLPASAVEAQEAPRFLVEKISVAGASGTTAGRIVVSSSLLSEGKAYTEEELREAVYRIRRLPFVLDADFALEKGSERGRFELRITIEEPRKVFLNYSAGLDLSPAPPGVTPSLHDRFGDSYSVGVRQFVGASGLAYASVDQDKRTVVGYTRYGLFGGGGYVDVLAATDEHAKSRQLSLFAALPIAGNHALLSSSYWDREENGHFWNQSVYWRYDSTDDPLFPRTGVIGEAGAGYSGSESHFVVQALFPPLGPLRAERQGHSWSTGASLRKAWPLTGRQSVQLGGGVSLAWAEDEETAPGFERFRSSQRQYSAGIDLGHLIRVDSWVNTTSRHELWLETRGAYNATRASGSGFPAFHSENVYGSVRLIFRNPWGILSLGLSYVDYYGGRS